MSRFGPQALPTVLLGIPQYDVDNPSRWNYVSVSIRNTGLSNRTITMVYVGGDTRSEVLPSGANFLRRNVPLSQIKVDAGTDCNAFIATEPEYEEPQFLATITGTANVSVTNQPAVTLQTDNIGLSLNSSFVPVSFTNGGTPVNEGWIHFVIEGTGSVPTVQVGATTYNLNGGNPISSPNVITGDYPVDPAKGTVTFGGGTIVSLTFTIGVD